MTEQVHSLAAAFVTARRSAQALTDYPGQRPADLQAAYSIQDAAIAFDGRPIAGWKVGRVNAPLDAALGTNRLAGPVFAETVMEAVGGEAPVMPVFADGFAAGEAELLLHVAEGWTGEMPTDDAATKAILDDVRLGIEVASSPYLGINTDGPLVTISDFGNNHGLVIGSKLADWRDIDLCRILVRTEIDGELAGEATAATMLDGPYGAVRFLLQNLVDRGFDCSKGIWVSTGAITGVHLVRPGQQVRATFGAHGSVTCTIGIAKAK